MNLIARNLAVLAVALGTQSALGQNLLFTSTTFGNTTWHADSSFRHLGTSTRFGKTTWHSFTR